MQRFLIAAIFSLLPLVAAAAPLSATQKQAIDESITEWLAKTGVPSVSIAVVGGNDIASSKAYGNARLNPLTPATTQTR